jgi:excisionase family DNA binding protein
MPKPFRLHSTRPLPADAVIVTKDGKPHVRMKDRGRTVLYPLTKDGRGYLRPSKVWYYKLRLADNTVVRKKGSTDFQATQQEATDAERRVARQKAGIIDPPEEHARRPLIEHLAPYAAALEAKGNTPKHVRETVARIDTVLAGCGFVKLADVDAARVSHWLNDLRRDCRPVDLPANVTEFTPSAVAKLLGVTRSAVGKALRRRGLAATGKGRKRRIPRAAVEALAVSAARGASPETQNHYVRAVRGFFRWLTRAGRIGVDLLATLALVNASVDVRRGRRELTADELRKLFAAARTSATTFRGLTGVDRSMLYMTAASTGFRASALASLTPADFDLAAATPTVTLSARANKSRKLKVQPLPADVAQALRGYLAGKPSTSPVWPGRWAADQRAAEMIRGDLDAVAIPYAIDGPAGPLYADFHALRHSFLTLGGRSGIDLRTLQELAGHSTPTLTARYSHRRLYDLAGAIEKLPNLAPPAPTHKSGEDVSGVPPGVPPGYAGWHSVASNGSPPADCSDVVVAAEPAKNKPAGADLHRPASLRSSAPSRARTEDPLIKSQLLYRLS